MKLNPYFGRFGGQFVPEVLIPALDQLEDAFIEAQKDPAFQRELADLLVNYGGRPTPLTRCRNLTQGTKTTIYLKREDLMHGGAHKTNQVLGQALLARRMGKTRIIAETGAGQHGVATALACALLGFKCRVYMGAKDVERQKPNVFRMELMGAEVVPVTAGRGTLKEACNAALRDWAGSFHDTHYMLGTAAGPHPFPTIVREFQKVIGEEARRQFAEFEGGLPDAVIACVGGGSNAIARDGVGIKMSAEDAQQRIDRLQKLRRGKSAPRGVPHRLVSGHAAAAGDGLGGRVPDQQGADPVAVLHPRIGRSPQSGRTAQAMEHLGPHPFAGVGAAAVTGVVGFPLSC